MNSKWHFRISNTKSAIRIIGCGLALLFNQWKIAVIGLAVAEVFGVVEEIGDKR